ncbi:MAG: PEP-CTERM sorting domain-containing protein [Alphaproteobacteria bacterium]|nr:PEP-CTERM sorting domain-containing protein [Alphaproteobacteria bacterium]
MRSLMIAAALGVALLAQAAHATVIQVGSQAGLGATDSVAWDQLGGAGAHLFTPAFATSTGGAVIDVSTPAGEIFRRDEGVDAAAGFAAGTPLLWSVHEHEPVQLRFSTPVYGVGAEIVEDVQRGFVATLTLFNLGNVLGSVSVTGGDGPVYLGALSDVPITLVRFSTMGPDGLIDAGLLLGPAQFVSVPEPSTALLLLGGLAGVALMRRRRLLWV